MHLGFITWAPKDPQETLRQVGREKREVPVVNDEAREEKRLDSEMEAFPLPWQVGMGTRKESSSIAPGRTREHGKEDRDTNRVIGYMAGAAWLWFYHRNWVQLHKIKPSERWRQFFQKLRKKLGFFSPTFNLNGKPVFFHHKPSTYFQLFMKHWCFGSEVACDLAAPSQALENCKECKELKKSVPGLNNSRMVTRFLSKQAPRSQNWFNRSYVKINVLYFLY